MHFFVLADQHQFRMEIKSRCIRYGPSQYDSCWGRSRVERSGEQYNKRTNQYFECLCWGHGRSMLGECRPIAEGFRQFNVLRRDHLPQGFRSCHRGTLRGVRVYPLSRGCPKEVLQLSHNHPVYAAKLHHQNTPEKEPPMFCT